MTDFFEATSLTQYLNASAAEPLGFINDKIHYEQVRFGLWAQSHEEIWRLETRTAKAETHVWR